MKICDQPTNEKQDVPQHSPEALATLRTLTAISEFHKFEDYFHSSAAYRKIQLIEQI